MLRLIGICVFLAEIVSAQNDTRAEIRALQADLTSQHAATVARERRLADDREERLFAELDRRDKLLRSQLRDLDRTRLEANSARSELDALIMERSRLVDEIAKRDHVYAAEIAEFRRQIAGLTETDNPALRAALERYADGDRVGAYPVIKDIIRAENSAAQVATNVRNSTRLREVAVLALDMKNHGEKTTAEVLAEWQEAQQLDPSFY
jgi:chromosome segregation ATPase